MLLCLLPVGVCIDVNFILVYMTIGSCILWVSTNYTFATVYKGRHTKEVLVIDEPSYVAVGLHLLEMSSITAPNQTISNVCTRYSFSKSFFRENMAILPICDIEKNSEW